MYLFLNGLILGGFSSFRWLHYNSLCIPLVTLELQQKRYAQKLLVKNKTKPSVSNQELAHALKCTRTIGPTIFGRCHKLARHPHQVILWSSFPAPSAAVLCAPCLICCSAYSSVLPAQSTTVLSASCPVTILSVLSPICHLPETAHDICNTHAAGCLFLF